MAKIRLGVKENVLSDPSKVTQQMYQDYLHVLGRGWVCTMGGKVVGFAYASRDDASIWALFLKQRCEGLGIGKRLLGFAVSWLFALGSPSIKLSTRAGTRADRFYGRVGWTRGDLDDKNNVTYTLLAPVAEAPARA